MDLLRGNLRSIYFKYLGAAFGSALISSIYTLVDMAMVGQYQGPSGTAALAVMAPIWNLIFSLGLLTGIGGSVLFSAARGAGEQERSNEFFSVALWSSVALSAAAWIVVLLWEVPMLRLFGGSEELLPLAQEYLVPIKFVIPRFPLNQMLAAFLRNDGSPALATGAVLAGGIFNIFGDFVFVFPMDMGIFGAGLATAIGAAITFVAMLTHFFSKRNTLRLVRPSQPWTKLRQVLVSGFSTFLSDVAMGILTMLFNRQIMAYLGTDALAVYGVIVSVSTFVQCCAYSVGQAAQPILSVNFGAGQGMRIRKALNYSLWSAAFFGLAWTGLTMAVPNLFIRIFMSPTNAILSIAPAIIRCYALSFLLLPFNIFSTYYFQALLKPAVSFLISISRGIVVSGALICLLPLAAADAIWFAMPITEAAVAAAAAVLIVRYTKSLPISASN